VVARPGQALDSRRGGSPIPAVAAALPLGSGFTMGLGLFGVAGMGVDHPANLYGGSTYSSYLQARLTPGVAYRLDDRWSFGLTVNAMLAQMKWAVAAGFGQVPHDTASSLGIGATLGLKYQATKAVALGAAYETRSSFQRFGFDVPAHAGVDPATFQPVSYPGGRDSLRFDQPSSATLGVAVAPVEALLLAMDVQWIRWSETNGPNQPALHGDPALTGAMPWNLAWSDQWVVKLGAQATVAAGLQLRAGYNYGKMPLDAGRAFENIAFPAVAEHHFTLGVGTTLARGVTANLGAMYSPGAELSGANAALPPQGGQAVASYRTRMSQYSIDAGLAYQF
jgi:long-chain fatty acid transport protein